jgi:hypothetical protein
MNEIIVLSHVLFGMTCMLAALWVFIEALNASEANLGRIRVASKIAAASMWLAFIAGGYWYVTFYKFDKAIILAEPNKSWHFAHDLVMETKEHLVFILLLLATYLPIVAANKLAASRDARRLMLWSAGLTTLLALAMDGEGGMIAMGVKVGLLHK